MRLLRRPAGPAEQAVAAARVRGLLTDAAGGWVPPPVEGEPASFPSDADTDRAAVAQRPGPDVDRGPGAGEPNDDGWPEAGPDAPRPGSWGTTPARPPGRHAAGGSAPAAPEPVPAAASTLLERLRGGRLDPGRRGVMGLALVALMACLLAGLLVVRSAPQEVGLPVVERAGRAIEGATLPTSAPAVRPSTGAEAGEVVVAVAGRVRRPGLVRLAAGSRVDDAVRAAGGVTPGATTGLLNLARPLVDGEQVLVGVEPPPGAAPAAGTGGGAGGDAGAAPAGGGLLDLNTATVADLDRLPGIGPVLAERILEHRTRHGPFRSVDQLREVSGIGEAKYASLRDAVTV